MKREDIDFSKYLAYSEASPSGLVWIVDRKTGKGVGRHLVRAGDFAGCLKKDEGYWEIGLCGMLFKAHRIVYELHYGKLSSNMCIDHILGNRADNRIDLLRPVTKGENNLNSRKYSNNTSGKTGVLWQNKLQRDGSRCLYASAQWHDAAHKKRSRAFPVARFGLLPAFAKACAFRDSMINVLIEAGVGYTPRHGT